MDAYAHGVAAAKLAGSAAVPASPFDRLAVAVEDLRQVQKVSEALADRIVGALPEVGPEKGMADNGGGGLIDRMERSTSSILGLISEIRADLQRIESRI